MTTRELTQLYRDIIQKQGYTINAQRNDTSRSAADSEAVRQHLLWMLDVMDRMTVPDFLTHVPEFGKFNRWLGFVQGVMWLMEWRTIDEMRDDARGLRYV